MKPLSNDTRVAAVSGRTIPLRGDDIDTDQIIPARYLKAVTFQGMEAHVFADNRAAARHAQRYHPFDDPRFVGGNILVVNANFGCGSSREHAPQGLRRFGIEAIVGVSFGEIFAGNCVSVGMPCVEAAADTVAAIQYIGERSPQSAVSVDLTKLTIMVDNEVFPIKLAEGRRQQLLAGTWDPTSVLLSAGDAIDRTLANL